MRKPALCICENKDNSDSDRDQLCSNCAADQCLCFPYIDTTMHLLSKSKIQASSHLLWLYSLVCVVPGQETLKTGFLTTRLILFTYTVKL